MLALHRCGGVYDCVPPVSEGVGGRIRTSFKSGRRVEGRVYGGRSGVEGRAVRVGL